MGVLISAKHNTVERYKRYIAYTTKKLNEEIAKSARRPFIIIWEESAKGISNHITWRNVRTQSYKTEKAMLVRASKIRLLGNMARLEVYLWSAQEEAWKEMK